MSTATPPSTPVSMASTALSLPGSATSLVPGTLVITAATARSTSIDAPAGSVLVTGSPSVSAVVDWWIYVVCGAGVLLLFSCIATISFVWRQKNAAKVPDAGLEGGGKTGAGADMMLPPNRKTSEYGSAASFVVGAYSSVEPVWVVYSDGEPKYTSTPPRAPDGAIVYDSAMPNNTHETIGSNAAQAS